MKIKITIRYQIHTYWTSQVAVVVKNLSANAGDTGEVGLILGLGRSLEEGKATHCSILAW